MSQFITSVWDRVRFGFQNADRNPGLTWQKWQSDQNQKRAQKKLEKERRKKELERQRLTDSIRTPITRPRRSNRICVAETMTGKHPTD